ncbi:MAG: hypothetical protein M3Q07_10665 [Pseudobdellovibrionaceae bacterium]|nr:hypothetical protein [Pseudobdellovibrionaceae bacterium]
MRHWKRLIFLLAWMLLSPLGLGQEGKNAKVAEVEAYLNQKVITYVNSRFPNMPVLVFLQVEPLRRSNSTLSENIAKDILPYFAEAKVDNIDEWDDPNKTVHDLLPRIRAVQIKITVPDVVTNEELFEMRDVLYSNLGLIGGRDKIDFERKNWHKDAKFPYELVSLVALAVAILLVGLFFIMRGLATSLRKALAEGPTQNKGGNSNAAAMAMAAQPPPPRDKNVGGAGNLQVNDSLRLADKIDELLLKLNEDPAFPTLEDMIDFEDKVIEDPAFVGTIMQEMPRKMQEEIFRRGSSPKWLDAFFLNSTLDIDKYQFVLQLSYRKRDPAGKIWQELLISMWRLGEDLTNFMKTIEQRDALGILAWMPTRISIPTAREAFPGGWGILLKSDFKPSPLPEKMVLDLMEKVTSRKPFNAMDMVNRYRHERGLLDFLRICTLEEERDIYRASKGDAGIHLLRPPFYPIFEGAEEDLKALADLVTGPDWGRALFNVDRSLRSKITQYFNDSKNYQMIETLKQCDQGGITMNEVGQMREKIARIYAKNLQMKQNTKATAPKAVKPEQGGGHNNATAA